MSRTILTNKVHNHGLFWNFDSIVTIPYTFRDQNDYYPLKKPFGVLKITNILIKILNYRSSFSLLQVLTLKMLAETCHTMIYQEASPLG